MKVLPLCFLLLIILQKGFTRESPFSRTYLVGNIRLNVAGTCYINCNGPGSIINLLGADNSEIQIVEDLLNTDGGLHSSWKHLGKRLVFNIGRQRYSVDPNFIYTSAGIKASLIKGGRYAIAAAKEVENFASRLSQDFINGRKFVIALHNNTDGGFSILNFKKGNSEAINIEKVFINPVMDADDFVLTTEEIVFDQLQQKKINVVLQKKRIVKDDGSLSVYASKKKVPYISIEVQQTHFKEQTRILEALKELIVRL